MALHPAPPRLPPLPTARPRLVANATLVETVALTDTIRRLRVRPDDGVPPFVPGQYFALGLERDGRLLQRPYSTASAPGERRILEFLVRRVPGGALTPSLWELSAGDRVRIGRPKGLFALTPGDDRVHLFVATGTGIAPFVSMVPSLLRRPSPPRIVVIQGAAHPDELAYRAWFASLGPGVRYIPALSRATPARSARWDGAVGRVDAVLVRGWAELRLPTERTVAYLCGNPGMTAGVRTRLLELGLGAADVRAEEYWTSPAAGASPERS